MNAPAELPRRDLRSRIAAVAAAPAERRRFVTFLLVGLLNTAVGYAIFAAFLFLGANYMTAAVGATVLGVLFNFQSIGRLVFGASGKRLLPRFLAVYALQCVANIALLRAFAAADVPFLLSEAVILPVLAVASFVLMRSWVFGAAAAPAGKEPQ